MSEVKVRNLGPKVKLIGQTKIDRSVMSSFFEEEGINVNGSIFDGELDGELLSEFAGRLCYMAFNRVRPFDGEYTQNYLKNIIKEKHFSVLEHMSFNFLVTNISRACSHELVRHRIASYSQLSQRYVRHDGTFVVPATMNNEKTLALLSACYAGYLEEIESCKLPIKEAHNNARYLLPESATTKIVCTFNMRSLVNLITLRTAPGAAEEIRMMVSEMAALTSDFVAVPSTLE